jgi:hypothetical protein
VNYVISTKLGQVESRICEIWGIDIVKQRHDEAEFGELACVGVTVYPEYMIREQLPKLHGADAFLAMPTVLLYKPPVTVD